MPPPEPQMGRSLGTPPIQPRKPFLSTDSNPIHHDFPGGPLVKNPPSNAGDVGSTPGRRIKIPQATQLSQKKKKKCPRESPGGPVVKNPPSNAGDVGSIPGRGTKIPTCLGATKPEHLNQREACML